MVKLPTAAPIPRVRRDRRDDDYDAGRPTPGKRAGAGVVVAIDSDMATVNMFDEDVVGVIYLGDPPVVGSVVEVEARGDLLVIPRWYEGPPPPPPWQTLPDILRTMVPTGYTTPLGTNGWSPFGSEMSLHSQRLHIYQVNGPVFNPVESFKIGAAWQCGYDHIYKADEGSPYWNVPTTRSDWSGSAMCEPLHGAVVIGANATSGVNGASCRASTSASGSQDALRLECRSTAFWINLSQIKTSRFGNLSSPSGGLPYPVPPPGFDLVWENPTSTLSKIEAAITEPSSNTTNNGTAYMTKCNPGTGEYGPVDAVGSGLNWTIGNATTGGSVVPGYTGGVGAWGDVTSQVNAAGRTYFMFVSRFIHDNASLGTGVHPFDVRETRIDLRGAFRFSVSPSRYKFVPTGGA